MSGSVVMQSQWLVLISIAPITTRDHGDIPGMCSHLGPLGCPDYEQNWHLPSLATEFHLSPEASFGPTLSLDSTVELAVVVGLWRSQPWGQERGRASPVILLM